MAQKKNDFTVFAKKLKALTPKRGDLAAMSKALGYSKQVTCCWREGISVPRLATLIQVADYFGVTVDWLLGREGVKEKTVASQNAEARGYAMGLRLAADAMTDLAARLHDKADRIEPRI